MSKKDIRKMSLEEIIRKIGIMIFPDQFVLVLTDEAYKEGIRQGKRIKLDANEVYRFIEENPDKIDKERLILLTTKNLRDYLSSEKSRHCHKIEEKIAIKRAEDKYEIAKKLLCDCDVEIPSFSFEKTGKMVIEDFLTVKDVVTSKRSSSNKKGLKERDLQIIKDLKATKMMNTIFNLSSLDDFEDYLCYYRGNGKFLDYVIRNNGNEQYRKVMQNQKEELSQDERFKILMNQYRPEFDEVIEKHCDKFDIEKMLLMSAYRAKDMLENLNGLTPEDRQEFIKLMQYAGERISNHKMKVSGKVFLKSMADKTYVEYSYRHLQDDLSRVVGGVNKKYYFSKNFLNRTREMVLNGQMEFEKVNYIELFDLLNFNPSEKRQLVALNPENFEFLVALNAFSQDEVHELISNGLSDYQIKHVCLLDNEIVSKSDIVKMYMKKLIDLSQMFDLSAMYPNLDTEVSVEELIKYYQEMKEDAEKTQDFERYSLLFTEFKKKGKNPEIQNELIQEIAMQICDSDSEYADFQNLYQFNLLPMQTLVEWNGDTIIYDLIKANSLKPRDAKDLLLSGELDIERVCTTLKCANLSDTEKLNFIFSSFDGVGKTEEEEMLQNDARMKLLQVINVTNDLLSSNEKNRTKRKKTQTGTKEENNKSVMNPAKRWQFFSLLDENLTTEVFLDGTDIFTLPGVRNGTVVIEKMLKHTKNGNRLDYGVATYMMSQEEFYNHKSDIVQGKIIDRKVLIDMAENGKAVKIVHSVSWGNRIKGEMGVTLENGYTQEKMKKIDTLIEELEKSRERVD